MGERALRLEQGMRERETDRQTEREMQQCALRTSSLLYAHIKVMSTDSNVCRRQVWPSGEIVQEKLSLILEMFDPVCTMGKRVRVFVCAGVCL